MLTEWGIVKAGDEASPPADKCRNSCGCMPSRAACIKELEDGKADLLDDSVAVVDRILLAYVA
jgi:hypothetical protein